MPILRCELIAFARLHRDGEGARMKHCPSIAAGKRLGSFFVKDLGFGISHDVTCFSLFKGLGNLLRGNRRHCFEYVRRPWGYYGGLHQDMYVMIKDISLKTGFSLLE